MGLLRKCIDCGFWLSFYSCRECGKPLCGVCSEWPSPRLHSPGKGECEACREKPLAIDIKWPLKSNVIRLMGTVPPIPRKPLRKCLQCYKMKREDFHGQYCPSCYEANEREAAHIEYTESGIPLPRLDRNLIYQPYMSTIPEPHDYAWYFLKWLAQWFVGLWHSFLSFWRLFHFDLRPAPYIERMARSLEPDLDAIKWPLRSNVISLKGGPPQSITSDVPMPPAIGIESGISLNQLLLSMGHEPVPNDGQSNRATLTLMKSIEEEIAERKKRQAGYEDMQFAAADWRMDWN